MVVLAVILGILSTGFSEVKRGEIISFPGTIEQVAPDFKFIVVNEAKIVVTPQTKIADGRGSVATINELKAKRFVRIEALRRQDGFIAQTILLLPLKGHAGK
jgi:hypothetical protein